MVEMKINNKIIVIGVTANILFEKSISSNTQICQKIVPKLEKSLYRIYTNT